MAQNRKKTEPGIQPDRSTTAEKRSLRDVVAACLAFEGLAGEPPVVEIEEKHREFVFEMTLRLIGAEACKLHDEAQKGDRLALESLLQMAHSSCQALQALCLSDPELVTSVAEKCALWPVMTANYRVVKEATAALLDVINLGAKHKSPIDLNKFYDRKTPARDILDIVVLLINQIRERLIALRDMKERALTESKERIAVICDYLEVPPPYSAPEILDAYVKELATDPQMYERLKIIFKLEEPFKNSKTLDKLIAASGDLPPLTRNPAAVKEWMKVIRVFITDIYDGNPEKSHLRPLGLARSKRTENSKGTPTLGSKSSESNIRDGIFLSIRQTLRNCASENDSEMQSSGVRPAE